MNHRTEAQMKDFDDVIKCGENMVVHAEAGEWSAVAKAEEKRRSLLNKLFANPAENQDVPEINKLIQKIITINKSLETLAIGARDKTRSELEKIKEGRSAINSYAQHT